MADYNEIAKRLRAEQDQSVGTALYTAADVNPDKEGFLTQLSKRTGIPVTSLRVKDLEQDALRLDTANKYEAIVQNAPNLANWLSTDQQNANLAHDDTENLGLIDTLVNSFRRGVAGLSVLPDRLQLANQAAGLQQLDYVDQALARGEAPDPAKLGVLGTMYAQADDAGRRLMREQYAPPMQKRLAEAATNVAGVQRDLADIRQPGVVDKVSQAKTFGEALSAFGEDPVKFIAAVGPESLAQSAPGLAAAVPAGIAAGPLGAGVAIGASSAMTEYANSLVSALQEAGVNVQDPEAVKTAVSDPELLAKAVRQAGIRAGVVGTFDALSGGLAGKALLPAKTLAGKPLARELANIGVQIPVQGAMGAAGEATASLAAGQEIKPGDVLGEFVGEAFGAPVDVVTASAKRLTEQLRSAAKAEQDTKALQELDKLAAASKVRQRDTDTFENFVAQASEEAPLQDVYIDAKALMQSGVAADVAAVSPSVAEQLPAAAATGGTIRIPVAEYAARIAGTELNQTLIDNLRTEPEGFSQNEAREFLQSYQEDLKREVEQALATRQVDDAFRASTKAVEDRVFAELEAAGRFKTDVNRAYATLQSAFASTMASKLGVTPEQFFEKNLLRVVAERTGGQQLDQADGVEITEDRDEDTLYSITATLPSVDGNAFINAEANLDGSFQIKESGIPEGARGQGLGVRLYDGLLRDLFARGAQQVTSDSSVSADAQRVYEALRRRGYQVEQAPNVAADPETGALEADGPVFTITPGQQLNQAMPAVGTPEFKTWFGNSKVVDDQGRPLVVYHGTRPGNDIQQFELPNARDGIYFTPDPNYAQGFTEDLFGKNGGAAGAIYPTYLRAENPYIVRASDIDSDEAQNFLYRGLDRAELERQGYDSAMLYLDGELDQIIVFDPKQIKSAVGNVGTFDPNNANILMQSLTTMVPKRKGVTVDPALVKVPGINEAEAEDPKAKAALENNVNLFDRKVQTVSGEQLRGYDSINPQGDTPKERAESIIDQMVRNLLTIHDAIPEDIRNRSRLWYDGANRISLAFAQRYGLTPMQSAAQLAVLSPQADWFMNVSYAERINDILEYQQDHTWDADMDAWADSFIKGKEGDRQKEAARRAQAVKDAGADVRSAERAKVKAESALEKNTPKLEAKIAEAEQALKDAEQEVKVAKKDGTPATVKRAEKQRDKRNDELKAAREALRTAKSAVSKADTAIRQANRTLQEKTDYAAEPDENLSVQPFIRGKKLSELDTDFERAWWVRAYDEAHHPRSYRVVTPEGGFLDFAKTDDGNANNSIGWKSFSPISKAIAIRRDGSVENVHNMLGNEHKVRNFYNNIYDPNAPQPFVTSDTHQVAANLFLPLGSAALEVAQNFGGTGTKGVSEFGLYGTYWLYSEAVARAAKERGVLPREMQSISWEAIRSLFKPSFKSNDSSVNAVRDLWVRHHAGEASYADTVNAIIELAGGYSDPSWVGIRPDSAAAPEAGQASYESELSHARQGLAERGQPGPGNEGVFGRELPAGSGRAGGGVLNQSAQPTFYSQLERSIAQAKQTSAPASDWLAIIEKLPGVKKDEIEWSGIREYLQLRGKDKVTRDELVNYMRQNGVEIEETMLSNVNPDIYTKDITDQLESIETPHGDKASRVYNLSYIMPNTSILTNFTAYETEDGLVLFDYYGHYVDEFGSLDEIKEAINQDVSERLANSYVSPQYSTYVLPGGENYRELLLRLPDNPAPYESPHWERQNVFAHIRFNERTDSDGNRVLFIEEIQSDWAQQGRKEGFSQLTTQERAEYTALLIKEDIEEGLLSDDMQRLRELIAKDKGVAKAPFVTDTKAWVALAVKRMVRYAAENGFDKVAFVTGKQSADRYNLSKQISRIEFDDNISGGVGRADMTGEPTAGMLIAYDLDGNKVINQYTEPDKIADYIGKELAEKLFASEPKESRVAGSNRRRRELSGLELNVGGEGMVNFYDKIVPQVVNDVLKKLGGGKLGITTINTADRYEQMQRAREESGMTDNEWANLRMSDREKLIKPVLTEQLAFNITPEMRDTVMAGQPLFQPARGSFNPETNTIALLKAADLSTFLHESGHFFLETQFKVAANLMAEGRMFGLDPNQPGAQQILDDTNAILKWFGVNGLDEWFTLDFEEQRAYHEKFAESFEAYLFDGKAPSIELQGAFQRFRSWLVSVYKSLKDFLTNNPAAGELNDEVRQVMDRMLATNEQIALAEQARSMMPLFTSPEQAGMTVDEFAAYQALGRQATADAQDELQRKSLRDLQWYANAKQREIRKLKKLSAQRRSEVRMDARREIMSQPVYQAWQFLTNKLTADDKITPKAPPKADPNRVQPEMDSLFTAIAKLGGLNRAEVVDTWSWDERVPVPVFGKPLLRREGGKSIDHMAEALGELGYLTLDKNGKVDIAELEEKFDDERRGTLRYSNEVDAALIVSDERRAGEGINLDILGAGRFDAAELRAMGIPAQITDLIVGLKMTAKNGLHPDIVAERFGFSSGDELVRTLAFAEQPKVAIEALTDAKMLEQYGELSSEEAIAREADKAIHNDLRARMLTTEANALAKAAGQRKVLAPAAKEFAAAMIARLRVREVKPGQYTAAEARAGKAAEKASRAGKLAEAAAEKRNQLVNNYAAKAAYQALDDVERGARYLKKFDREATRNAIATEYVEQIDALLERFDLRKQSLKAIDKRASLAAWIESQRAMGIEPEIPEDIANEAMRKSYKDMTVEEFRGLVDTVRQIEHLGRLKERLLTAKDLREYKAVRDLIANSIKANAGNRQAVTREARTTMERVQQTARRFGWAHIKANTIARILDGGQDAGPVWEYFIRSANERGDFEVEKRAKATEDITRILEPVFKLGQLGGKGQFFPSIGQSLNREARIALALNTGNEGNLQRLLGGEGWTMQQIEPVLQSLTAAEWQTVQNIWDYFESYRPEIAAKEKRVYGKEPNWVDPKGFTITTADGQQLQIKGGYYPIKYDPNASQRAEEHADADAAKRQLQGAYTSATTRRSFTKTRAEEVSGRPLLLSLEGVYSGLNEVIHDLAWHEWLIDANRLLRSETIDSAIRQHYGPEVKAQLKNWVRDVAEGDRPAANAAESALSRLRQGVSAAGLGFNVMNAMLQVTGFIPAGVRIGWEWVGKGAARYMGGPIAATTQANELSSFMKNRSRTRLRELAEVRNRVQDANQTFAKVNEMAYFLMLRTQQVVDTVTWWGAFEKALAAGQDEDRAIALADQSVLDSQGGGQLKDLSGVERGGPALKLFTVYYSYMNTMLNLGTAEQMTNKQRGKRLANQLLIFTVAPMLGLAIKEGLTPDGEDEWDWGDLAKKMAAEQLAFLMGLMVVVREFSDAAKMVAGVAEYSRDYGGPAGLRAISEVNKLATQFNQGEVDDAFVRASINTVGALTGLPAAQVNRTIAGAEALAEDKTDNPTALVFGYQK